MAVYEIKTELDALFIVIKDANELSVCVLDLLKRQVFLIQIPKQFNRMILRGPSNITAYIFKEMPILFPETPPVVCFYWINTKKIILNYWLFLEESDKRFVMVEVVFGI